jgi:hypothetical protein
MYKTSNARLEVYKAVLLHIQVFSDLMPFLLAHFTILSKVRDVFLFSVRQFILQ